jgi:hypothetical protein
MALGTIKDYELSLSVLRNGLGNIGKIFWLGSQQERNSYQELGRHSLSRFFMWHLGAEVNGKINKNNTYISIVYRGNPSFFRETWEILPIE